MDSLLAVIGVFGLMLGSAAVAAIWAARIAGEALAAKMRWAVEQGWISEQHVMDLLNHREPK